MAYTLKTRRLKGKVRSNYPKHIFSFNAAVSNRFFFFFSFVSEVFCFQRGTTEINGISSAVLTVLKNDISQIQQQQVPETMSWLIRWPCCQHLSAERLSKKENCWQHVLWIIPAYTAERYCFSFSKLHSSIFWCRQCMTWLCITWKGLLILLDLYSTCDKPAEDYKPFTRQEHQYWTIHIVTVLFDTLFL